ncbi:FtsK/SpoIIIE family DNA translocase [Bauldia litoralis]|uniref:FtsK/SpoIIIE family DNA translocase n=1 Tax=Bauldia litoralis TaxID=665467 RepID=UPI0032645079
MRSSRSVPLSISGDGTVRRLLKRNLSAVLGLVLLALIAAIAASLATWTVDDPSLSHATSRGPHNALGFAGAIVSDLAMQFFGIAGVVLLLAPVVWAWRLIFGSPTGFGWWTLAAWIASIFSASLALATLPVFGTWPLPTGIGGVVGDLLLNLPAFLLGGTPTGVTAAAICTGFAVLAVVLTMKACGFAFRRRAADVEEEVVPRVRPAKRVAPVVEEVFEDEEDEDEGDLDIDDDADDERDGNRGVILYGALTHSGLRMWSALRRRLRGRRRPTGMARRQAPRLAPEYDDFPDAPWDDGPADERLEPALDETEDWQAPDIDDGEPDYDPEPESEPQAPVARPRAAARKPTRVAPPAPKPKPGRRAAREAQASFLEPESFILPPLDLLSLPKPSERKSNVNMAALEQNARLLEGVLEDFGVRGEIVNVRPGPVVTLYELEPAPGIKSARVIGLADDIARSMSAIACRVAVIPGKNAIGIELPNARRETVYLREMLSSEDFEKSKAKVGLCLGKTIGGEPVIADLARMPHLLVAGTTGSGKSVSINTFILSILFRMTPDQCRLIMIDPKMLELSIYDGIPHLLTPVVTDPKQAVVALKWTVREMEDRYRKMSKLGVRNIDGYNARVVQAEAKGETLTRTVQTGFDRETGEAIYEHEELSFEPMPFIVVIIDEMADLMMVAGKDIEGAVQRLAQMARAAGIHVVMATQRPSVDVITGTIKANFPTRISFQVTSKIDSRTILGEQGAEQLLGMGDMLFMAGGGRIQRVHGPFVSDEEVEDVVAHLKTQGVPEYLDAITADDDEVDASNYDAAAGGDDESNDLYDRAVAIVARDRKASTSYIQRRLSIGYNRAASIIERMENEGVVGAANHAGKREILVREEDEEFR